MKATLILVLSVLSTSTALAVDWLARPVGNQMRASYDTSADWSGTYAGLHLGYGKAFSTNDWMNAVTPWTPDGDISMESLTGGGMVGYQQQFDAVIAGIEADLTVADFSGDDAQFAGLVNRIEINALGSLRGRLGWTHNNFMIFGTAGVAAASFLKTEAGGPATTPQLALGWTAGGGVEMAVTQNWRLRAEYLHTRLGDVETNLGYMHRANAPTIDVLRVGATYRF